jgi:3-hydroxybutyryl-CoA dehydrogenase
MGAGIAGLFARAGIGVGLADRTLAIVRGGLERLEAAHETLVAAGLLSAEQASAAIQRIQPAKSLEEICGDADFFIETIAEDLEEKKRIFARAHALCRPSVVLASNTSGLSITALGEAAGRPGQVVGLHFWNPPHIVPLVEIVRGKGTSDTTVDLLLDLARALGKRPIVVQREVPGFVGNRLQFAVFREALFLLENGIASAEDIDTAMTAGPGLRYGLLGPLRTADLGGLDVFHAISGYLFADLSSGSGPSSLLARLVAAGRTGTKTGRGFYEYGGGEAARIVASRDQVLLAFLEALDKERQRGGKEDG